MDSKVFTMKIDHATARVLERLARAQDRSQAAMVRCLIREAATCARLANDQRTQAQPAGNVR